MGEKVRTVNDLLVAISNRFSAADEYLFSALIENLASRAR